jgi:polyadenylate-binding protein
VNFGSLEIAQNAMAAYNYTEIRGKKCRIMWSQRDPNSRRAGVGNVFVKNLPPTVDSKALADIFGVVKPVASAKVVTDEQGNSRCYGYVTFNSEADAKQAVDTIHGMPFLDQTLDVKPFVPKSQRVKA